ncbi:carboxypeptidase regulatory-like domain-containing protein [Mucilaginibacter litoreus]|uniref:Carboxypeptidase regulatory-like domain-containing protein n=1 Tax=Mucilaginibacter litoreus TaxID=1048221 RepID=A0ABW3AUP9_9SPHI
MAYKRIVWSLLFVISAVSVYSFNADDDIITKITRQLERWAAINPVEKAYLHLDKPYYTAGDDIWFKAYVIKGAQHKLQPDSGILNVELIDELDSIKQSIKVQLHNGLGYGDFPLPDTIHEGNYRIRAYTQYMRNTGSDYFFDKAITIGNIITNKVFTKTTFNYNAPGRQITATINYTDVNGAAYANKQVTYNVLLNNKSIGKGTGFTDAEGNLRVSFPADNEALLKLGRISTSISGTGQGTVYKSIPIRVMAGNADVQFFPEGGNMVSGIPTRVAFKAIGTNGLGTDIKGNVIDNKGKEVAVLNTAHLGMGVFNFTPQGGNAYKAKITYADGSVNTIALPTVSESGYVMSVSSANPATFKIRISANKVITEQLSLIAQSNGKVYYSTKVTGGESAFTANVPVNKFLDGIIQFTLFSASGEPLNERLAFAQSKALKLEVKPDKQSYNPREAVKLGISTENRGNFSVSVIDETKVPVNENNENNIFASLLLTSDIKGYIEQPAYYFNNPTDKKREDLDILLMTQGYRRFDWKTISRENVQSNQYPEEKTFTISGTVTTPSGQPVKGGKVELINFDDGLLKLDTVTDANGRFAFHDIIYPDSIKFLIQARTAKNKKNVVIRMDSIPPPLTVNAKNIVDFKVNPVAEIATYAQNSRQLYFEQIKYGLGNHVISLREVQIRAKKNALKHSSNLNGPGNADQVLFAKDINYGCIRLADCLQGRLLGVIFRNGVPFSTRGGPPMLVVIDGLYANASLMNTLNTNDVQSIEVLRNIGGISIYGSRGAGGVLIITTKRGDEPTEYPRYFSSGIKPYAPKGIYHSRTFYSPKYDAKTNKKLADLRTTIYWNPNVVTYGNGNANLTYFNAGSKGTYRIVVEGIDDEGNIGRAVYRYKVE